jgi:hypothetical protein
MTFGLGVVGKGVVAELLGGDGVAEAGDAVEAGVDVVAVVDGCESFGFDGRRNRSVTDALGEVDAAHGVAGEGHGADFRLHGGGGEVAEGETGLCGNGHGKFEYPYSFILYMARGWLA